MILTFITYFIATSAFVNGCSDSQIMSIEIVGFEINALAFFIKLYDTGCVIYIESIGFY